MTKTRQPRRGITRFRVRPARLVLAFLALAGILAVLWAVPNYLSLLLRLPAPNPLAAETALALDVGVTAPYSGRCVALRVYPAGQAVAAVIDAAGITVTSMWPDGRVLTTKCPVPGDVAVATFGGAGYLLAWASDRATGVGQIFAFGPVTPEWMAQGNVVPAWTHRTTGGGAGLLALAGGNVAAIGTAADGTPAHCTILAPSGRVVAQWSLADGIYTAWDAGGPSGTFGLAGAIYDAANQRMSTFVRSYQATGGQLSTVDTAEAPALRMAVSASGKHVLLSTTRRLMMLGGQESETTWSRSLPGVSTRALHVYPDGRALVTGPDVALVMADDGRVVARFRATGQGAVSRPVSPEYALLSLPGGCVAIDSGGRVAVRVLWEGQSQLIAADATMQWLVRADGTTLTLYVRGGASAGLE